MDLRSVLETELRRRQGRNPRYSLRAFARSLRTHHSTLTRILEARGRLTSRSILQLGERLGLSADQIRDACAAEHCAAIRRVVGDQRFRADSRWIAMMTGIPIDDVNVALHRLLHRGELVMRAPGSWILGEH